MNQASVVALMKAIAPAIRDYLSDAVMPLHRRIAALEQAPKPATDEFIRHIASESASEAALAAASLIREQFDALPVPKDGKDGLDGEKGDPGRDGTPGAAGLDGKDGRDGVDGKDGSPGLAGAPGKDGEPGQPGLNGKDGTEGRGVQALLIDGEGSLVATFTDGVVAKVGLVKGKDGAHANADEHRQRLDAHAASLEAVMADVAALKQRSGNALEVAPDDVAELVAKASALMAEPTPPINRSPQPIVLNVGHGVPAPTAPPKPTRKTMTLRQNDQGEVVAEILEREVA